MSMYWDGKQYKSFTELFEFQSTGDWHKYFCFCRKINGKWIVLKIIYRKLYKNGIYEIYYKYAETIFDIIKDD